MDQPEKQPKNQIDNSLKLTGFARYSIRLHMLRKLALSDDPITSLIAQRLITDRMWRRVGGVFEFLQVAILPFTGLVQVIQVSSMTSSMSGSYIIMMVMAGFFTLIGLGGSLVGAFTAILPGKILTTPVQLVNDWKVLPFDDKSMFKAIVGVQKRSYLVPLLINSVLMLFAMLIGYIGLYVWQSGMNQMIDLKNIGSQLADPVAGVVSYFTLLYVGIYVSLSQKILWASFVAFLVIQFMMGILASAIMWVSIPNSYNLGINNSNLNLLLGSVGIGFLYLVFLSIYYFLASKAVRKLTMPET